MLQEATMTTAHSTSVEHLPDKGNTKSGDSERFVIRIPRPSSTGLSASPVGELEDKKRVEGGKGVNGQDTNAIEKDADWCIASPNLEGAASKPIKVRRSRKQSQSGKQGQSGKQVRSGKQARSERQARFGKQKGPDNESISMAVEFGTHEHRVHLRLGCSEYRPFKPLFQMERTCFDALVDVRIPVRMFAEENNGAVLKRAFWGGVDGKYTDDSDPVCILLQQGFSIPSSVPFIKATFKISPRLPAYPSHEQNGLKSRQWIIHAGHSIEFVSAHGCTGPARNKSAMMIKPPSDHCTIRFSSLMMAPVMNYSDLLMQLPIVKGVLQGTASFSLPFEETTSSSSPFEETTSSSLPSERIAGLHLEGHSAVYILILQSNGRFGLSKTPSTVMFTDLEWEEIGWMSEGLSIRSTFLNIRGYRWHV